MWIFFSDFTGSQVGESLLGHSTLAGASVRGEQSAGPRTLQGQIQWSLSENRIKRVTPNLLVNKLQCPVGGIRSLFRQTQILSNIVLCYLRPARAIDVLQTVKRS